MIVDDHPMLRRGVANILNAMPDMTVVAEAGSTEEALAQLPKVSPDLVLLDLHLREGAGLDIVPGLRRASPSARILVYTGYLTETEVRQAIAAEVQGYVLKSAGASELVGIVREVAAGGVYWASETTNLLIAAEQQPAPSPRELEVLGHLAAGRTNRQIAEALALSVNTVIDYVLSVRIKLGARNRAEAVHQAIQRGLL